MTEPHHDWLQEKLSQLLDWAKGLPADGSVTEYKYFTALKLIAVSYYSSVFTKVVNSQIRKGNADAAVYVDLLAGTGLVNIRDASHPIRLAGSPTCAAFAPHGGFQHIVCVESKTDRCDALTRRLEVKSKNKFDVIRGDCNKKIDDVISSIKSKCQNPIVLVFVDPEAFEIKFKTLLRLGEAFERCDFMIHVNSQAVKREQGKITKNSHNASPGILEGFFDMSALDIFENLTSMSPEQQYVDLVKEKMGKKIGDTIKICNSKDQAAYHILCYTRETGGGSRYASSIKTLKKHLEQSDANSVKRRLEVLSNGQQTLGPKQSLDGFFDKHQ